ncbi:hypothetical protein LCGC14_1564380 [marine sediment metagenome]|uniref:Uncharacterized protein n=1 Tax=marine sediment metagenome TaxID=412755 RepID=A0A0F9LM30_9ZZZZ
MTLDESISDVRSKARGRTRYEGQEPFRDEVLVAEINRLREALVEIARGRKDCGRPLGGQVAMQVARVALKNMGYDWGALTAPRMGGRHD